VSLKSALIGYPVTAVVHGHAHNGSLEGRTTAGTPVYNVSLPLMRKMYPGQPPFRMLNVPRNVPQSKDPAEEDSHR
jgi:hypothetical protein